MYDMEYEEEVRKRAVMNEVLPDAAMWAKWEKTEAPLRKGRGWYPALDRHFLELLVISEIATLSHPLNTLNPSANVPNAEKIHRHAIRVRRVACERIGQERLMAYCDRVKEAFEAYVNCPHPVRGEWGGISPSSEDEEEGEAEVDEDGEGVKGGRGQRFGAMQMNKGVADAGAGDDEDEDEDVRGGQEGTRVLKRYDTVGEEEAEDDDEDDLGDQEEDENEEEDLVDKWIITEPLPLQEPEKQDFPEDVEATSVNVNDAPDDCNEIDQKSVNRQDERGRGLKREGSSEKREKSKGSISPLGALEEKSGVDEDPFSDLMEIDLDPDPNSHDLPKPTKQTFSGDLKYPPGLSIENKL